jgi:Mannosylglycerate hydrolase MGH1-like glycoside hydrolase domain
MKPLFNNDGYETRPGVLPEAALKIEFLTDIETENIVRDYIDKSWQPLVRPPLNQLKQPYLVPGATYDDLWDWDAFFTSCAIPEAGLIYSKGSIINLLDSPLHNGRPSKKASVAGEYDYYLHPYPLRAQFAYIVGKRLDDFEWLTPYWNKLLEIMQWYETATCDSNGFFRWQTLTGIDNNPSIYGRQPGTIAGVDLAAFHYREYLALSKLAAILNFDQAELFSQKAENLKQLMQTRYWDVIDGMFYDIDRNIDYDVPGRQQITWDTYLKFRNWSCLYPLWAKMATKEQAAILRDKIMDENEFLAPCGIRSHSKKDPVYNNELSGGPSNWQGPVWGLSTCLTVYGLINYGFTADAYEVARRQLKTYALDIRQNGCMHEYYHGDTGQPIIKPGFFDWNILAGTLIENIKNGHDATSLDLYS